MLRHEVYSVTTPDNRRAKSRPRRKPDEVMERAAARRWGGARSPTSGSTVPHHCQDGRLHARRKLWADILNCGVTVVTEVIKVREQKTAKELVRHSPSLFERSSTISV